MDEGTEEDRDDAGSDLGSHKGIGTQLREERSLSDEVKREKV